MPITKFPPIETADEQGILALGGDLHPESLLLAYSQGIFPWPISEDYPIAWFCPNPRGVIKLGDVHIPRKLKKFIKNCGYTVTFNQSFSSVIETAAIVHEKSQHGTWINSEIIQAYKDFHKIGFAYSVEVLEDSKLIGGLYGVNIGQFVSGESMFHKKDNASKIALLMLLYNLNQQEINLLDTQMITSVTSQLGATEIERSTFIREVKEIITKRPINFESFETSLSRLLEWAQDS